ncbi:MAG: DNA-3-methyladenine glycosylase [Bacteroidota bacterium]
MILPKSFYQRDDVCLIAQELLGKLLITQFDGIRCVGKIVETEAYRGWGDAACHSHRERRTNRTKVMYEPGGVAYVYLCYGIHNLFNIITNVEDRADAVLIRGIEPIEGVAAMQERRGMKTTKGELTAGPGRVSQAMGIDRSLYGIDLGGPPVWLEDAQSTPANEIETGPRVGVAYAGKDALLPWRYWVRGNGYVSKARPVYDVG